MDLRPLGRTGLRVSAVCLGTMTFGRQNTEAEGHAQMDLAFDRGVTFWDTAEMYAVPPTADTYGRTEEIIGTWLKARGRRDRVVIATKAIGNAAGGFGWVRGGGAKLDRANLVRAVDDSLRRLGTDYIDLFQTHWPDRPTSRFGARVIAPPSAETDNTPIAETLSVLDDLVKAGKIRHVGVSNETPWGVMAHLAEAERRGLPRIAGIQNAYNLLNRTFEDGLAEVAMREDVGLLAYSPLGGGTLTGKYLDGAVPPGSRRSIDPRKSRYATPRADGAVRRYLDIARRHGLDPAQMAVAWVHRQPFVTAAIIGATSLEQLRHALDAVAITLTPELLAEIDAAHAADPNPCP